VQFLLLHITQWQKIQGTAKEDNRNKFIVIPTSSTFMMSSSSQAKKSTREGPATKPDGTMSLLAHMKLRSENDVVVYQKLRAWVALQILSQQISPTQEDTGRTAATLLLQRLLRAFEQRAPSVSTTTTANATKSLGVSGNVANSIGNNSESTSNTPAAVPKKKVKPGRNMGDLSVLMQRRVKVTRMVQQAVQFIGSDILKVLQGSLEAPSVADVAHSCLLILKKEDKMKELYALFCNATNKDMKSLDENSTIYFGVFAMQALETLRSQAVSKAEIAYDFEFLYLRCYKDPGFQACLNALNPPLPPTPGVTPIIAKDTEAKNICWKLSRLLALKLEYISKRDSETKLFRRNHIISSAATILIAADLGKWTLTSTVAASPTEEQYPAQKRQKTDFAGNFPNFFDLILEPISELVQFLSKNSYYYNDMEPITKDDVQRQITYVARMIEGVPFVQEAETTKAGNGNDLSNVTTMSHDILFLSTSFTPTKRHFVLNNYRRIIHAMVMDIQRRLNLNPLNPSVSGGDLNNAKGSGGRTAIGNVLFLFPMVVGEPWGIHRDAPVITSNLLCSLEHTIPPISQKDSIGVVLTVNGSETTTQKAGTSANTIGPSSKSSWTSIFSSSNKNPVLEPLDSVLVEEEDPPESRPAVEINLEDIEPPLIDDSMELNEWTLSILSLSVIKPSDTLLMYLGEHDRTQGDACSCLSDVIVPVLNRGVIRIHGAVTSSQLVGGHQPRLSVGRKDGQVYVNGEVDESVQLCASVLGFYYYSLECIIRDQMQRIEFLDSFNSLLQSEAFHRALLACCYSCALKGVGATQKILGYKNSKDCTVYFLMQTIESNPYTFLKVTEALRRALILSDDASKGKTGSPIVPGLPAILQQHMQTLETQLVDSIVWAETTAAGKSEGSLPLTIQSVRRFPGAWPPDILEPSLPEEFIDLNGNTNGVDVRCKSSYTSSSESSFLSYVLRKLLKISFFRIQAIFAALDMADNVLVQTQVLVAFRYLLRHCVEVFFERHIDQLLLCSIYGVCKVMKVRPEVTFGKLIDAYYAIRGKEQGERSCRVIVRHVKLVSSGDEVRPDGKLVGNLIVFYNQIYVPKMHRHFFGSKSLERSTAEYRMQHISGSYRSRSLSRPVDVVAVPPAKSENTTVTASSAKPADDCAPSSKVQWPSVGSLIPGDCRGNDSPSSEADAAKVERKADGNRLKGTQATFTPVVNETHTSDASKQHFGVPAIRNERDKTEPGAEHKTPTVVVQTETGNLEGSTSSVLLQSCPEESVMSSNHALPADAMETDETKLTSSERGTNNAVGDEGADSAPLDAPQDASTHCVDIENVNNSDSSAQDKVAVMVADSGGISAVATGEKQDYRIDPGKVSENSVVPSIGVEAITHGDGTHRIFESDETIVVDGTSGSSENSASKQASITLLATGETPINDQPLDAPRGSFGGGDTEATSPALALQSNENKGVHIVEKIFFESTDAATNGSLKRTFSAMDVTDSVTPS
jgi:hypothetical protein